MEVKKIIFIICSVFYALSSYAETCPTIADIRSQPLKGWKFYDSYDGTLLSEKRVKAFRKDVEQFVLAEWSEKKTKGGIMHCYYSNKDGSDLDAYLSKEDIIPKESKKFWYPVTGFLHCAAEMEKCKFEAYTQTPRLAKKHSEQKNSKKVS